MSLEIKIFGQIETEHLEDLNLLLLKISGNFKAKIRIHDMFYKPKVETEFGPRRNDDLILILRRDIVSKKLTLIQQNQIEIGSKNLGNHRMVNTCEIIGRSMEFLDELGYEFWYEIYRTGYEYSFGDMKISYCKYYKLESKLDLSTRVPLQEENTWIVEAFFPKSSQDQLAANSSSLFSLAKQLSSVVDLAPVDHTILQTKIRYSDS